MKKSRSTSYKKGRIVLSDGEFIFIETGKKDAPDKEYSLTEELNQWLDVEGVTLSIKKEEELSTDDISDEFIED